MILVNHNLDSEFFKFLGTSILEGDNHTDRIPSLTALSKELGVSVARLREKLEVAKALGFVEARPRTGIRRLPYSFTPAIWQSLSFAIAVEPDQFMSFAILRRQIELAFWGQAVQLLTYQDRQSLRDLMNKAYQKLNGAPFQIPHI